MTLSEKYLEEYFDHWIAMLFTMNSDLTESGIKEQIEMYKNFEGEEEFIALQLELKTIINNGDLEQFLKVGDENGKIQLDELERISELILSE